MPLLLLKKKLLPLTLLLREKEPLQQKEACSWSALVFGGLRHSLLSFYLSILLSFFVSLKEDHVDLFIVEIPSFFPWCFLSLSLFSLSLSLSLSHSLSRSRNCPCVLLILYNLLNQTNSKHVGFITGFRRTQQAS